jgi:NADH-quinone oxidoreductase subunit N
MTFSYADWTAIAPAMVVILGGLVTVGFDLFKPSGSRLPLVGLGLASLLGGGWLVGSRVAWDLPKVSGFGGSIVLDGLAGLISLSVVAATALVLVASDVDVRRRQVAYGEYYGLVLLAAGAMMLLSASNDFLVIFVNLEVLSLALYVLTGITRRNPRSNEAAVKYFVTGAFATGFLLMGVAMLYGATGSIRLDTIGAAMAAGNPSPLLGTGLGLVLVGFAFKVGAVPFHTWVPDVYEGAPATTTAFMAVTVKAAGFAALFRILLEVGSGRPEAWGQLIWWMAVLTMVVGNLLAAQQTSVKRMLAYSSIAHTGYVLVAAAAMVGTDGGFSAAPVSAALFYLVAYAFTTLGAFQFLVYLGHEVPVAGRAPEWQDAETLEDLQGLARRRPWAALAMTLFLVSLGGFPPTAGFVGKFWIFQSAVDQGHVTLAVIGVLASLVSLYYYLRVVVAMFMRDPLLEDERPHPVFGFVVAVAAVATLLIGLAPGLLWDAAARVTTQPTTVAVAPH